MTHTTTAGSSTPAERQARVLVVDDEPEFLELYSLWLAGAYDIVSAASGEEALEKLTDDVDVVLLDRRMDGIDGFDVVEEIRARDVDVRIVMITAVEPDTDIVDVQFDEYLVKPVAEPDLRRAIAGMLERTNYASEVQEYFALASKVASLESTLSEETLEHSDRYAELRHRAKRASEEADAALDELRGHGGDSPGFRSLDEAEE